MSELSIKEPSEQEIAEQRERLAKLAVEQPSFVQAVGKLARITLKPKSASGATQPKGLEPVFSQDTVRDLVPPAALEAPLPADDDDAEPLEALSPKERKVLWRGFSVLAIFVAGIAVGGVVFVRACNQSEPKLVVPSAVSASAAASSVELRSPPPTSSAPPTLTSEPSATVTTSKAQSSAQPKPEASATPSAKTGPFSGPDWGIDH
jgi:hypothetical protein